VTATSVVLNHYDLNPGNVISHAEWTTRKRDPYWNGSLRAIETIRQSLEDEMSSPKTWTAEDWQQFGANVNAYTLGATYGTGDRRRRVIDILTKIESATAGIETAIGALAGVSETEIAQAVVAEMSPALRAAVAAELDNLTMKAV
jgi:hypothetical protein